MKKATILKTLTALLIAGLVLAANTVCLFAVTFDDTYCERNFKGEKLWTSTIRPNDFKGTDVHAENGVYHFDWVHQIWDKDHKQLYTQERYDIQILNFNPIVENIGEWLDGIWYSVTIPGDDPFLRPYYSSVEEIPTPDGCHRMELKVSGYDAVYIYTEDRTPGDGNGVLPYTYNKGYVYVPLVDAPNERGLINTLEFVCSIQGYNYELFDAHIGEYLSLLQALPCTIQITKEEKVFKKGAPTSGTVSSPEEEEASGEEKDSGGLSPLVPVAIGGAVVVGGAIAVGKALAPKKPVVPAKSSAPVSQPKPAAPKAAEPVKTEPAPKPAEPPKPTESTKPAEPPKPEKTPEEIKKEQYVEKLKEKYGYEDEKELKKAIMRDQIHNEQMGYIYQKDEAFADAALDTAEKAQKIADVTIDVAAELSGPEGKVAKNIYTGLKEFAEAGGEIMTGRDAAEALTEATVDASVGVIENEANGFTQKLAANAYGEGAKKFASTYMKTEGDLMKSLDAANDGIIEGTETAVFESVTDAAVGKAVGKAAKPADEALAKTLENGVNASKAFAQDLIKDAAKGD